MPSLIKQVKPPKQTCRRSLWRPLMAVSAITALSAAFLWAASWGEGYGISTAEHDDGSFYVHASEDRCVGVAGQTAKACRLIAIQAQMVAESLRWPFRDGGDCAASHGAHACERVEGKKWRVRMVGFAAIPGHVPGSPMVAPVFSSAHYPGLYLPNGYPVQYGWNEAIQVMDGSLPYALTARSLLQPVCRTNPKAPHSVFALVSKPKATSCSPLHSFVRSYRAGSAAGALFKRGKD